MCICLSRKYDYRSGLKRLGCLCVFSPQRDKELEEKLVDCTLRTTCALPYTPASPTLHAFIAVTSLMEPLLNFQYMSFTARLRSMLTYRFSTLPTRA